MIFNNKTLPRGLRNCNPGNIRRSAVRYKGEREECSDNAFLQFKSMEWGYRAMFVLLHTYALHHNCTSIRSIINRYAPPSENNTENYIRRVALATGINPSERVDTLNGHMMTRIVSAMSEVENGVPAVQSDVAEGWRLFRADF